MTFTRHERLIIYVFKQCRSMQKTLQELESITGKAYSSPRYVMRVISKYKKEAQQTT